MALLLKYTAASLILMSGVICASKTIDTNNDNSKVYHARYETITLAELEKGIVFGADLRLADNQIKIAQSELLIAQAEQGLKVYGSVFYDSLDDPNINRGNFNEAVSAEIGIEYPLFGSWANEKKDEIHAKYSHQITFLQRQSIISNSLFSLRDQYITYWENFQLIQLARQYIRKQTTIIERLTQRKNQGLLLEADRLEFLSSFDKARTDLSLYSQNNKNALNAINYKISGHLTEFAPVQPDLSHACADESMLLAAAKNINIETKILQLEIDRHTKTEKYNKWLPIESSASAGVRVYDQDTNERTEQWRVGATLKMPLNISKAMQGYKRHALISTQRAHYNLKRQEQILHSQVAAAVDQFRTDHYGLAFANRQIQTYKESVREATLRYSRLDGDVLEKMQQARYQYYRAAANGIIAQADLFKAQNQLLSYLPNGCDGFSNMRDHTDKIPTNPDLIAPLSDNQITLNQNKAALKKPVTAIYIWQTDVFIDQINSGKKPFAHLKSQNIDRVLVSLDRRLLNQSQTDNKQLKQLITLAHSYDIEIELLLGDPSWIMPQARHDLLDIIESLSNFEFDGLHLDLEPEQLELNQLKPNEIRRELIKTLYAVNSISTWPISLSTHFRNMETSINSPCLGCALENMGLKNLTLMIYVANPKRVVEIADPIFKAYPKLNIAIAQSIEPFLKKENTLWAATVKKLISSRNYLNEHINKDNYESTAIQSWRYFMELTL